MKSTLWCVYCRSAKGELSVVASTIVDEMRINMQDEGKTMTYELAKADELQVIYDVVQQTIKTIYPKYYPAEVVDFFCKHHSRDAIAKDIENGCVSVLKIDGKIVGTGSYVGNHITRVYVLPECQKKGYGTFIMKNIESNISEKYDKAQLDASLPAAALYEKLGYCTIKHERHPVENEVILVYEVMEKELSKR